jgi:hypothetical protein
MVRHRKVSQEPKAKISVPRYFQWVSGTVR